MEEISSSSSLKRARQGELEVEVEEEILKRQKSYKDIITLLEEEEDDPNEDLSSIISTLQEEIISGSDPVQNGLELNPVWSGSGESGSGGEEEEVEKVMKHLLEASDDELGIPNTSSSSSVEEEINGYDGLLGGHVDGGDGLWEFEDHEANNNYYEYSNLLLQSEIFM